MSIKANERSKMFLQAFGDPPASTPVAQLVTSAEPSAVPREPKAATRRTGLKHIGGYFDRENVEMIVVLRARLGLDNSQLIQLAVSDLFKKLSAQRAFDTK